MATNVIVRINHADASHSYASNPGDYIDVDLAADRIIWTAGSAAVYNHCGYSPSASQLNVAATLITGVDVEVAECFLDDVSSVDKLHTVIGMGSNASRYVFCFSFDGATATEPTLEAWDTSAHSTFNLYVLGNGGINDSMIHAICTTAGAPSSGWSGTSIAGSGGVINLDNGGGALSGAADLYANIYIKIPASFPTPEASTPVLTIRYTYV